MANTRRNPGKTGKKQLKEKDEIEAQIRKFASSCDNDKVSNALADIPDTLHLSKTFVKVKRKDKSSSVAIFELLDSIKMCVAKGEIKTACVYCDSVRERLDVRMSNQVTLTGEDTGKKRKHPHILTPEEAMRVFKENLMDELANEQREYIELQRAYEGDLKKYQFKADPVIRQQMENSCAAARNVMVRMNTTSYRINMFNDNVARTVIVDEMKKIDKNEINKMFGENISDEDMQNLGAKFQKAVESAAESGRITLDLQTLMGRESSNLPSFEKIGNMPVGVPEFPGSETVKGQKAGKSLNPDELTQNEKLEEVEKALNALYDSRDALADSLTALELDCRDSEKLEQELIAKCEAASPNQQKIIMRNIERLDRQIESKNGTINRYQGRLEKIEKEISNWEAIKEELYAGAVSEHSGDIGSILSKIKEFTMGVVHDIEKVTGESKEQDGVTEIINSATIESDSDDKNLSDYIKTEKDDYSVEDKLAKIKAKYSEQ